MKNEKPKLILPDSCRKRAEELQAESMSDDGKLELYKSIFQTNSGLVLLRFGEKRYKKQEDRQNGRRQRSIILF